MRIEHVNLTVSDLDRSIAFYTDLLGWHVRWKGDIGDGLTGAHVGDDHEYLALFEASEPGRARPDYGRVGVNHVGFLVEDLDATRARLLDMDVAIHHEAAYEPGRRIYITDPDGHEVELVEY